MSHPRRPSTSDSAPAPASELMGRWLIYSGWAVTLLYFPSGALHVWFGSLVYLRDILLFLHLFATLVFFGKMGWLSSFLAKSWVLLIIPLMMLPALFEPEFRIEAGTVCKWVLMWLDWILIGRLLARHFDFSPPVKTLSALTALLLAADLGTGFHEWQTNTFVFPMQGEVSAFGVEMGKDQFLAGSDKERHARIKGLQRDVFSFANLMGMAVVAGLSVLAVTKKINLRIAVGLWIIPHIGMLYASGGRSAFFGVTAAGLLAGVLVIFGTSIRKYYSRIALGWLIIGLVISFVGVGTLADSISAVFMKGSYVGNSSSAFERDDNWDNIKEAISQVPIVLFTGSPVGAFIDSKVQVIFHWADNNYLWLLYHTGMIGLAAMIFYFRSVIGRPVSASRECGRDCLMLFLLYVMGEAIARESLTFLGCMPLFVACGFVNGSRASTGSSRQPEAVPNIRPELASRHVARSLAAQAEKKSRRSPSRPSPAKTDHESFAQRIARKAKNQKPPP